jgi:putative ATP-binding cassette transporter
VSTAHASEAHLTRETWRRFGDAVKAFATSEVRGKAAFLFGSLLTLLVAISGLNVLNSYVGRDFMTAIEHRHWEGFVRQAFLYVAVFAASTAAAVLCRYSEERIGLLWRGWLTRRIVEAYLTARIYYRLAGQDGIPNADQRITEDVRTFVTMTLSLSLMALNSTLTVIAFSSVLWSISRTLFVVGIAYAAAGSLLTVYLGRRLVALNYAQSDREADFRTALIDVGERADSVALAQQEPELQTHLEARLDALVHNFGRIIGVNRNLGFFTTGYNYMIQIIPALIVAPLFIRGDVEFGVITQSAMAFSLLLGAFSLIITQFPAISSYAAVLARLTALAEGFFSPPAIATGIKTVEDDERVAYERLTLRMPDDERVLVRDLSVTIPRDTRFLICSGDPLVRGALMRATAGLWHVGEGCIARPALARVAFLPERPYVPPGTLRAVVGTTEHGPLGDAEIWGVLVALGVEAIVERAEGFDVEQDWDKMLSMREQALVAVARLVLLRPRFAFVENLERAIDEEQLAAVLQMFGERRITHVAFGDDDAATPAAVVLDLAGDGRWRLRGAGAATGIRTA